LSGEWEWKPQYELADQMIRIIDSTINTEVEKVKTPKAASFDIQYVDPEDDFYNRLNPLVYDEEDKVLYEKRIVIIEAAIKGDTDLEYMWEAVKEGKKRKEIAELFEIEPNQLSKLRERFIEKVQKFNQKA
jgi:16S rRNA G966 N2-methylase RsmD